MHSPKVIIVAQVFISGMMAFLMTAFFAILHLGLTAAMLDAWVSSFVIAWPVAFCFSLLVSPVAFMLAGRVVGVNKPQDLSTAD
jgi:membrane protein implicated in regulation of membrane protease activity